MNSFRVLHLSDIHIGDTYMDSSDIAYRIISDLESESIRNIRCVIVTGDIFEGRCGENADIISEAVSFFKTILKELQSNSQITKEDILFVPGNHDVMRTEDESIRWTKYSAFLEGFYGKLPNFYDKTDFSLLKTYDDSRIAFAGFNSCGLKQEPLFDSKLLKDIRKLDDLVFTNCGVEKKAVVDLFDSQTNNQQYVDFGEITPKQILRVKRELSKYDDYTIIAFFHHHFYLFPEVFSKYGDSSLIRNYTNVIQQLQQAHVKTVLHGHKHFDLERPLITDSYYEDPKSVINIIAGGSVGTNRVTRHTFNVIDFFDKNSDVELIQRKFIYNNDQLEPIVIRQIPPRKNHSNAIIRLLDSFRFNDPDLYAAYSDAAEKINIATDDYNNILKWLESIFEGFDEIHKIFESNSLCVFFLLYAMNYRVLKIKQIIGKERIDGSYYRILNALLQNVVTDVGFDKKQYLELFEQGDLNKLKEKGDKIFDTIQNKNSKYYLSFSMIGIFITDIYLMLRYYAGSFYRRYIKYKVNIKLDETEFHQNVPVQKIMIHSDADRRSAFIDLRCNSANAHKLAVLFVKEFELIISKFEDYFKTVGLKVYYIIPRVEKGDMPNAIDNYNFEAYIPTLIPLLTGDNIYAKKEVFARELIQNSIDAIAVRASTNAGFDKTIYITLGKEQGREFFRIKDCGTGMDRFKIERYFTSIGRSFYSGDEYRDLEIDYKPISNFGIGFLSAFMVCREIDVKTRYYLDDEEGLRLHIPNFDGCFFIEKDDTLDIGTEITLYIDQTISHNMQSKQIVEYILETMQDVSCDIIIKDEISGNDRNISSKSIRRRIPNDDVLFIPFLDSGKIEKDIDVKATIRSGEYIEKYPYGLIIDVTGTHFQGAVLNSGIKLYNTNVDNLWEMLFHTTIRSFLKQYQQYFLFDFPSNYFNIDVSREKIASLAEFINDEHFGECLLEEIAKQIGQYLKLSKTTMTNKPAEHLQLLLRMLSHLCDNNISPELSRIKNKFLSMQYILYLRFNEHSVDLIVNKNGTQINGATAYVQKNYKKCIAKLKAFLSKNTTGTHNKVFSKKTKQFNNVLPDFYEMVMRHGLFFDRNHEDYYYLYRCFLEEHENPDILDYLQKTLKSKEDPIIYAFMLMSVLLVNEGRENNDNAFLNMVLHVLLQQYTISEIENGKCVKTIQSEDFIKVMEQLKDKVSQK